MRIVFMGTPEFAVPAFKALMKNGYDVVAVYTQPPRPKNRGYQVVKTPIHKASENYCIPVYTPTGLKRMDAQKSFFDVRPDLAIVVAYGLILPESILHAPCLGCLNIHGSLLPRWRGAAPIHRAMLAGDAVTGITLMQMDEGLDTGDIIRVAEYPLVPADTFQKVHDDLSQLGANLLIKTLPDFIAGKIRLQKQPLEGMTYAQKLGREEGLIDWSRPALDIMRHVKTLNPWPGAYTFYKGQLLKIKDVSLVEDSSLTESVCGTLHPHGLVTCGRGILSLDILQREGGKPLSKDDFLRGFPLTEGKQLGC